MNELTSTIYSAWTVVVCLLMVGIACWAWSGARRAEFDAAARLPLEADDERAD